MYQTDDRQTDHAMEKCIGIGGIVWAARSAIPLNNTSKNNKNNDRCLVLGGILASPRRFGLSAMQILTAGSNPRSALPIGGHEEGPQCHLGSHECTCHVTSHSARQQGA